MSPDEFLESIYLGDRACKGVYIDTWGKTFRLQVDTISRVRNKSGEWKYYADEDIVDGYVVFDGLREFRFDPSGPLPNDFINAIQACKSTLNGESLYEFSISVSSGDEVGNSREVIITILATDCYLEELNRPGVPIR